MTPPRASGLLAFLIVTLIWGSTWLVIKDQVSVVPPPWTVAWRFYLAAAGMTLLALWRGQSLRLPPRVIALAGTVGVIQFTFNFQLVYHAEIVLTSGIVALLYAVLMVPNALLGRIFLGTALGSRFLVGSAIALCGVGLLLAHELQVAPAGVDILGGTALALGGILCASVANVLQAGRALRSVPIFAMLAWAMLLGAVADTVLASIVSGPPVFDSRPAYLAGLAYLALAGSVVTFPLYFALIRDWGPGKAAYNGVAVPVVAMALSTVFEGYRWSALAAGGAIVAVAGLLLALSRPKRG